MAGLGAISAVPANVNIVNFNCYFLTSVCFMVHENFQFKSLRVISLELLLFGHVSEFCDFVIPVSTIILANLVINVSL